MVWRSDAQQGDEAAKVRHEIVQYFRGDCVDLGCGPRKVFPARFVKGIDSNKDAGLFGIQARPDEWGDCESLARYADGAFDTVFSSHLLEHCADYRAVLAEWWRVLKPGGHLVLYLPHAGHYPCRGMPGANPDHRHDFVNDDITEAMRSVAWRSGHGWVQVRDEVRSGGDEYSFLQVYRKGVGVATEFAHPRPIAPGKSLGIVRLGAYGDALWISTILPHFKREGWHITLYTQRQGESSLRHDPHIDEMVVQPDGIYGLSDTENGRYGFAGVGELQTEHLRALERKHDKFINLIGTVEGSLLPHITHPNYWLPDSTRRAVMNQNYLEVIHRAAGVPFDRDTVQVRFYASDEEKAWAKQFVAPFKQKSLGFVVVNPSGSSLAKWWPHAQAAMDLLAAQNVAGVLLGDLKGAEFKAPEGWQVLGTQVDIRKAFALAAEADVVIGVESAIVNSVAHEGMLKIVLLSHSTPEQLTRDWHYCIALQPEGLACYPCHRIHVNWGQCMKVRGEEAAACQYAMSAETVAGTALQWLRGELTAEHLAADILEAA